MQPFRVSKLRKPQYEATSCPPKGAVGQALPKGKPVHLVIDRHPETGNPMMLEVRNQRAETHRELPMKCQPWLGAGTVVVGTLVNHQKSAWYVLHDVYQVGGRWLWGASHRERLGALVGILNALDCSGLGLPGWPRFATATLLPESDGVRPPQEPTKETLGYAVRQVQHKVLSQTGTIFLMGEDAKGLSPTPQRSENGNRNGNEKRPPLILSTKRNGSSPTGSPASSPGIATTPSVTVATTTSQPKQQPKPTMTKKDTWNGKKTTAVNKGKSQSRFETVTITAGEGGPDDYVAADASGKRSGPVSVRSLNLSLKLNQLLRGQHYDLYRPPGPMRILPRVSLSCCWEAKHQCWRPELDFAGTKAKVT
jgi:putative NIF3 family GTP cyclohydrolase 1 type 2